MKLFLLSSPKPNFRYGDYKEAVVCAPDEASARLLHPAGYRDEHWFLPECKDYKYAIPEWALPQDLKVQYLGEADVAIPIGIICVDQEDDG